MGKISVKTDFWEKILKAIFALFFVTKIEQKIENDRVDDGFQKWFIQKSVFTEINPSNSE